jgi:hypothetical protein
VVNVAFRSDVLGQVMPLVGRDWSQSGVARLFSAIKVWKQTILSFCFRFPLSFSEIVPVLRKHFLMTLIFQLGKRLSTNIP